jgi:hypothetical protein
MIDVRRIRFVTARFRELQGLAYAVFGGGMLAASLVDQYLRSDRDPAPYAFDGLVIGGMLWTAAKFDLGQRYRATFGHAVGGSGARDTGSAGGVPMFALMAGAMFDALSGPLRTEMSIGALGLAVASLFVVTRDGWWRPHYLVPVAAGLAGAYLTSAALHESSAAVANGTAHGHAMAATYALAGFGLLTAGLFDHLLLVDALTPIRARAGATARERVAGARSRAIVSGLLCLCGIVTFRLVSAGDMAAASSVLVAAFMLAIAVGTIVRIWNTVRQLGQDAAPFALGATDIFAMTGCALAMTLDAVLGAGAPYLTMAAFAAASAGVAAREWPLRRHYLLGVAAAGCVWALAPHLSPAAAVMLFLVAASGALTVENLADARLARTFAPSIEDPHADTI